MKVKLRKLGPGIKPLAQVTVSLISILWVAHVFRKIDWGLSREALTNFSNGLVAACFFFAGLIYLTRLFRLHHWTQSLSGRRLSIQEWIDLYLKSIALGSITPARLGDFSRIPLLIKTGLTLKVRSKVIIHDKLADLLYIPVGICLTAGIVGEKLSIPAGSVFAGGMLSLFAYLSLSFWFGRFLGIKALSVGWAMTLLGLCFFILSNTFLFWAVGIDLTMLEIAAITLSVGMIVSLPISVGGIGIREGSLIVILGLWGISSDRTPPILILEVLLNLVFPVALYGAWKFCLSIRSRLKK